MTNKLRDERVVRCLEPFDNCDFSNGVEVAKAEIECAKRITALLAFRWEPTTATEIAFNEQADAYMKREIERVAKLEGENKTLKDRIAELEKVLHVIATLQESNPFLIVDNTKFRALAKSALSKSRQEESK